MGRNATGIFMQLIAVVIGLYFMANYWQTGKQVMREIYSSMEFMHLNTLAGQLDALAAGNTEDDISPQVVLPYPATYADFCAMAEKDNPRQGARAWHDRWGTALWYDGRIYQGIAGYAVASAGADKRWRTRDDLWVGRYGEKSWSLKSNTQKTAD